MFSSDIELRDSDVHVLRHRDAAEREPGGGEEPEAAARGQELRARRHRRPLLTGHMESNAGRAGLKTIHDLGG